MLPVTILEYTLTVDLTNWCYGMFHWKAEMIYRLEDFRILFILILILDGIVFQSKL